MKILAIGLNAFREAIRDKVLLNLLFFALALVVGAGVLSTLTVGERNKIIVDLSLAAMNIVGALMAIFLGISLVSKEIDRRTIYNILSKPVRRYEFLLGKYLGLAITLGVNTALMALLAAAIFPLMGEPLPDGLWLPVGMIYLEMLVVVAGSLLFSTFTTTTLGAVFSVAIYLMGHLSGPLLQMAQASTGAARTLGLALYYLLPNFDNFNYKPYALRLETVPDGMICASLGYGVLYITFVLSLAILIFQRREFK